MWREEIFSAVFRKSGKYIKNKLVFVRPFVIYNNVFKNSFRDLLNFISDIIVPSQAVPELVATDDEMVSSHFESANLAEKVWEYLSEDVAYLGSKKGPTISYVLQSGQPLKSRRVFC